MHGLQDLFTQVRSFAFVAQVVETTELFRDYGSERALGLIFGGDVLDVGANLDYGTVFGEFVAEHVSAVNHQHHRALVLGDVAAATPLVRENLAAFEEIRPPGPRNHLAHTGTALLVGIG